MAKSVWNTNDWVKIIKGFVKQTEDRLWHLNNINYHDWRDIEQEIIIHIWKKRGLYNKNLPFSPWVKRIVGNQIKNALRKRFKFHNNKIKKNIILKHRFKFPIPLTTKSIFYKNTLNECVVYQPDVIDNLTIDKNLPDTQELIQTLKNSEKDIFNQLILGKSIKATANSINIKTKPARVYQIRARIRDKYNKLVNSI